ncbi:MAG: hypothetical protein Q7K57_26375 [Burkholderiaceae bacterium]|nr:hypothetical protein [Burkholderiaceae bacterium]
MPRRRGLLISPTLNNGPKPTPAQVQALVDAFQQAAKTTLPILVVANPSEIDGIPVNVAPGRIPTGGVIGGRIYLFTDNLRARGEVLVTIFHELFQSGLHNVVPDEQYAASMRDLARSPLVQRYMTLWKDSSSPTQAYARAGMTLMQRVMP